ncbi:hypothetical protein DMC64_37030 [Amycolatopsis sp. WAC 04197]|uniref:YbaB/EbfC family nucleoid-associated protein n=1 Tax=Amycolatopsis sp. WAC 04197 TaxID=2203199 RepID=UPI000F79FA0C|nr:YbaB/EbfC family nucleoid-associated protein [Amycolatopsis sp. WAC 04197]RSN39950.1 hypothetical protein DMC64_37030 [Amycolatopsis sp. WAC 04197]
MNDWTSPGDSDRMLEKALADLNAEREKLTELSRVWKEETTTVKAKDQSLSMTFDGRGDLVDLVFNESKYRAMPPAQLASVILETLRNGRAKSLERMNEIMGLGESKGGLDLAAFAAGELDAEQIMESLMGPMYEKMDEFGVEMPGRHETPRHKE